MTTFASTCCHIVNRVAAHFIACPTRNPEVEVDAGLLPLRILSLISGRTDKRPQLAS